MFWSITSKTANCLFMLKMNSKWDCNLCKPCTTRRSPSGKGGEHTGEIWGLREGLSLSFYPIHAYAHPLGGGEHFPPLLNLRCCFLRMRNKSRGRLVGGGRICAGRKLCSFSRPPSLVLCCRSEESGSFLLRWLCFTAGFKIMRAKILHNLRRAGGWKFDDFCN